MTLPEALIDKSIAAVAKQNDSPIENPISAYLKQGQISILSIPLTRKIPLKHMPKNQSKCFSPECMKLPKAVWASSIVGAQSAPSG